MKHSTYVLDTHATGTLWQRQLRCTCGATLRWNRHAGRSASRCPRNRSGRDDRLFARRPRRLTDPDLTPAEAQAFLDAVNP